VRVLDRIAKLYKKLPEPEYRIAKGFGGKVHYWSRAGGWVRDRDKAEIVEGKDRAWAFVEDRIDEDDESIWLSPARSRL
jgi:hypothetical protein